MTSKTATRLLVRDVMTRNPLCVGPDTSARELAEILVQNEISGVPVVDAQDHVIGVVSKTDLLDRALDGPQGSRPGTFFESLADGLDFGSEIDPDELGSVEEFMSVDPVTASPDEPVSDVSVRMADEAIHRIVVTDAKGHVVGIVTSLDLLKVFPG